RSLSLDDALPILSARPHFRRPDALEGPRMTRRGPAWGGDFETLLGTESVSKSPLAWRSSRRRWLYDAFVDKSVVNPPPACVFRPSLACGFGQGPGPAFSRIACRCPH